jgi:hypothetical protein
MVPTVESTEKRKGHVQRMEDLRPIVFARANYRCEAAGVMPGRCSLPGALQAHHRLTRQHGGPDTPENLVALCPNHHQGQDGVHRHPEVAYDLGLLIRAADGPPTEPWSPPGEPLPRFGFDD